ncbi:hypothetical protein DL96DRAFT_1581084, partial [Flagelloscypha sp. PMI_526]
MASNGPALKLTDFFGLFTHHSRAKYLETPSQPKLPVELLQPIFIIASNENRSSIPSFARVSKIVSTWVLPILYTTLFLSTETLSRLIHQFKPQRHLSSPKLKYSYLQYPTTSLIITGPPSDIQWPIFFASRFLNLQRMAFETTGRTEPKHLGELFWQILSQVKGPQVVSFRLPSTAEQIPISDKRFGGFGMPRFQNTTHLSLNWMTLFQFYCRPEGVKMNEILPVLRFLFIQGVEVMGTMAPAMLNDFSQLRTVKKISITLAFKDTSGSTPVGGLFMNLLRERLQPNGEKLMWCSLPGWDPDPDLDNNPFRPGYFEALDDVWKEMKDGQ